MCGVEHTLFRVQMSSMSRQIRKVSGAFCLVLDFSARDFFKTPGHAGHLDIRVYAYKKKKPPGQVATWTPGHAKCSGDFFKTPGHAGHLDIRVYAYPRKRAAEAAWPGALFRGY